MCPGIYRSTVKLLWSQYSVITGCCFPSMSIKRMQFFQSSVIRWSRRFSPMYYTHKLLTTRLKAMGIFICFQIPMGFLHSAQPWVFRNMTSYFHDNIPACLRPYIPLHILMYTQPFAGSFIKAIFLYYLFKNVIQAHLKVFWVRKRFPKV